MSDSPKKMDDIVALCRRRGFIFQSSEIYGGINGFWDYGPLGTALKRNLKNAWWGDVVERELLGPDGQPVDIVGHEEAGRVCRGAQGGAQQVGAACTALAPEVDYRLAQRAGGQGFQPGHQLIVASRDEPCKGGLGRGRDPEHQLSHAHLPVSPRSVSVDLP